MRGSQARRALSSASAISTTLAPQLRGVVLETQQLPGGFSAATGSSSNAHCNAPAATSRSFTEAPAPRHARAYSRAASSHAKQVPSPNQSQRQVPGIRAEFPGARSEFTSRLSFVPERAESPVPCFQVLDLHGNTNPGAEEYEVNALSNGESPIESGQVRRGQGLWRGSDEWCRVHASSIAVEGCRIPVGIQP